MHPSARSALYFHSPILTFPNAFYIINIIVHKNINYSTAFVAPSHVQMCVGVDVCVNVCALAHPSPCV